MERNGDGAEDSIEIKTVLTRYVRMYGNLRTTAIGFSLFEFEIYGPELGIVDLSSPNARLFPNPIENNNLNIRVKDEGSISVALIDILGRTIDRFEFQGKTTYRIETSNLDTGLAFVKITAENWTTTLKVIKK